jgi:hypothetical protein
MSICLCGKINIPTHNFWFVISMAWPKYGKPAPTILSKRHPKNTLKYTAWEIEAAQKNLALQVQECYTKATRFWPTTESMMGISTVCTRFLAELSGLHISMSHNVQRKTNTTSLKKCTEIFTVL